jgi:Flp pilus assembly protein TadG
VSARLISRSATRQHGQALVELALVLPVLLLLATAVVGVGRLIHAQMGVSGVARESARTAVLADSPTDAISRGLDRGQQVADGYHLTNGSLRLSVDPGSFSRGGSVVAMARYQVTLGDLPLLGWLRVGVASTHAERIDLYRSQWPTR